MFQVPDCRMFITAEDSPRPSTAGISPACPVFPKATEALLSWGRRMFELMSSDTWGDLGPPGIYYIFEAREMKFLNSLQNSQF